MDGHPHRHSFPIQILASGLVVSVLYIFLTEIDTSNFSISNYVLGPFQVLLSAAGLESNIIGYIPQILIDIILFTAVFLISLILFAQFTLPVRNLGQRILAGWYLFLFSIGQHGAAIRVQDGKLPVNIKRHGTRGPGVIILDTASAALLRERSQFTRSVGPGLVFTRPNEYIAGTVDLHRKAWPQPPGFGPLGDVEDPFLPRDDAKESLEAYEQRQKRRYETSAETRDGIEVVPNIFVFSQVDPDLEETPPNQNQSPASVRSWLNKCMDSSSVSRFGYSSEAVRLALTGELVDPNISVEDGEHRKLSWYQLPGFLAVDLWREYARKFTFEELFQELPAHGNKTALQVIQQKVAERLRQPLVEEISSIGQPTGKLTKCHEFSILRSRGIKVLFAPIRNLHFQKQIDQQLEDKWFAYWRWRADDERDYVERLRSYHIHEGEMEALRDFSHHASLRFEPGIFALPRPNTPEDRRTQMFLTLERMLRGTLRQCLSDSLLHPRLAGEEEQLAAIINYLRRQKSTSA